ncbi:MAG: ketopantoate reductase family protein [Mogibacterium sp.]|nr:ketopantoate reductase family protein [Mogibacterium sp.]
MIRTVGIIGAGSVGSALMYEMYKRDPENVYLLATGARAERLNEKGISVNNEVFHPAVYSDPSQGIHIDLLILAAKTYSMDSVIKDIRPLIDRDTILLPIENGITTSTLLEKEFPENRVFYGVVLRTDAHRMSRRVYYRTLGEMQIGYADNHDPKPEVIEAYERLKELGINVKVYEDMRRAKWRKWMLNTGASQTAVEVQAECGFFGQVEEVRELMKMLMDEILELAWAEGVNLTEEDRDDIIEILVNFPPDKKMSMLQDYEAGRTLEIDEYAGEVVRLGKKHGIPTPANEILYLAITARQKIAELRKG